MTSRHPLVGVTTYYTEATWGPLRRPAAVVTAAYFELVAQAGARPVLLPPTRSALGGPAAGADDVVAVLDALVLIGGGDLDPASYGQVALPQVGGVDDTRDRSEHALLASALERDVPVLAVCRGHQLLNVHLGGSLHQHLPAVVGHDGHRRVLGEFHDMEVTTSAGSIVSSIFGDKTTVRCSHHQAVDRLGAGLVVTARSIEPPEATGDPEGVIEAIELPGPRFVVGLQWHPEDANDGRPFRALVEAIGD